MSDQNANKFQGADNPKHLTDHAEYRKIPDDPTWGIPVRFAATLLNDMYGNIEDFRNFERVSALLTFVMKVG